MRSFTTTNKSIVNVLQNVVEISKASIINSNSEKLWKKLRELCFDKINRGVENE